MMELSCGTVVQTTPRSVSVGQHLYSRRETYSGRPSNTPTAPTCERQTVGGEKTLEVTTQRKSGLTPPLVSLPGWTMVNCDEAESQQSVTELPLHTSQEQLNQGLSRCSPSCDEAKSQQSVTELPLHTSQEQLNQGLSRCSPSCDEAKSQQTAQSRFITILAPSCDEAKSQQSVTELPLHTSQEQLNQGLSRCSPSCDEAKSQQSVTELPLHTSQEQLNQGLSRCSPSCDEAKSQQSVTELPLHTSQEQLNQGLSRCSPSCDEAESQQTVPLRASSVSLASEYGARTGCDVVAAST
ncbi:hypothetical protein RRG08_038578 [Elysia crispata]|uniref:Uncharacterized protein n=1 Tax=Elysia crispata TaxID=231223 RepID=A0AAE0YFQ5_9GAST|nr:hypothetical protein RRG08_038578 [Elysia crispata]